MGVREPCGTLSRAPCVSRHEKQKKNQKKRLQPTSGLRSRSLGHDLFFLFLDAQRALKRGLHGSLIPTDAGAGSSKFSQPHYLVSSNVILGIPLLPSSCRRPLKCRVFQAVALQCSEVDPGSNCHSAMEFAR